MKDRKIWLSGLLVLAIIAAFALLGFATPSDPAETNGLIAFLTDYGQKDFYVGAVKGVIYSTFPEAKIVDITHQVTPFDIHEGAVTLMLAAREFPQGTVFVAVVDPGVGTERRSIALETENGFFFTAPDNGLLTLVIQEFGLKEMREIMNEEWMRLPVSYTFHGRDIFAPTGAHLAQGWPFEEVGPVVEDPVLLPVEPAKLEEDKVLGEVLMIDQYGNMQANITGEMLEELGLSIGDAVSVQVGEVEITSVFMHTYGDVPEGEDLIFVASTDLLEISINWGNAAEKFGAELGSPVIIARR